MHLTSFRVQNYKIIKDTGWVPLEQLNAFIGKNESGKSAIFKGLSKLNPSDEEGYDGLKEFPRKRYAREILKEDWPVASGRFILSDEEKEQLVLISDLFSAVCEITVTRHYTGTYDIEYHPEIFCVPLVTSDFIEIVSKAIHTLREMVAPDGKGEEFGRLKESLLSLLNEYMESLPPDTLLKKHHVTDILNFIISRTNEEWQIILLSPLLPPFEKSLDQIQISDQLATANIFVIDHIPTFIYFDHYDVIEGTVHIPSFLAAYNGGMETSAVRATNCLFLHVNLDPNTLDRLSSHKYAYDDNSLIRRKVDERAILLHAASNQMTEMFENWWEQRCLRFRYDIDGDYFRIWVSDNLDSSEIELDQRSAGLQYFFSFFLIFLAEAHDVHQNSIMILDEPGLTLHPTAQRDAVAFLKQLSEKNQILYSTHSPFLLDMERCDNIHIVSEENGSTKVASLGSMLPIDDDSLFPVEGALAYHIVDSLLIQKKQVLIEDITEHWLIQAMNYSLGKRGKTTLDPDIMITPVGGSIYLLPLASLMKRHQAGVVSLISGVNQGVWQRDDSTFENVFIEKQDVCNNHTLDTILWYGTYVHRSYATIEDFFSPKFYFKAVIEAYPHTHDSLSFSPHDSLLEQAKEIVERHEGQLFERWKVAEILSNHICESPHTLDDLTTHRFEQLMSDMNRSF